MVAKYSQHTRTRTPVGSEESMIVNNAGGLAFAVTEWVQVERFLILGSEGGSYYVGEAALTIENTTAIQKILTDEAAGLRLVDLIVQISVSGRAIKNDPALYALALAASSTHVKVRQAANAVLYKVARTGTHLMTFVEYVLSFRGWGRSLKRAVGNWYLNGNLDSISYQVIKYRQRLGWTHADLLRLTHPISNDHLQNQSRAALFDWIVHPNPVDDLAKTQERFSKLLEGDSFERERQSLFDAMARLNKSIKLQQNVPVIVHYFNQAQNAKTEDELVSILINAKENQYPLPWEAIPTEYHSSAKVWSFLISDMPPMALLRNLNRLTNLGLFEGGKTSVGVQRLMVAFSKESLRRARLHPINILIALKTYASGVGFKGSQTWTPVSAVVDLLDAAFYDAFEFLPKFQDKRILVAVDSSGSMTTSRINNTNLRAVEAAAAMSMVLSAQADNCDVVLFDTAYHNRVDLSARRRMDDVIKSLNRSGGGTDTSQAIQYAIDKKKVYDAIIVITDSETWANQTGRRRDGKLHEKLKHYRAITGVNTKFMNLATTANGITTAEPSDPFVLECVGFDASIPSIVSDFVENF